MRITAERDSGGRFSIAAPRFCMVGDCGKPHKARGLCWYHYQQKTREREVVTFRHQHNAEVKVCNKCGNNLTELNWRPSKRRQGTYKCTPCVREWERGREGVYKWERRRTVLEKYGGKCSCCGDDRVGFLSIDHVNNDGAEDRRKGIAGQKLISFIIKNNFPDRFQVLCFNCNLAKQFRKKEGVCPCQG